MDIKKNPRYFSSHPPHHAHTPGFERLTKSKSLLIDMKKRLTKLMVPEMSEKKLKCQFCHIVRPKKDDGNAQPIYDSDN